MTDAHGPHELEDHDPPASTALAVALIDLAGLLHDLGVALEDRPALLTVDEAVGLALDVVTSLAVFQRHIEALAQGETQGPVFRVELDLMARPLDDCDAPAAVRLRRALKALGRTWKFRCTRATSATPDLV
jgi:hypothetical protein